MAILPSNALGTHTEETRNERDTCSPMFTAALFTIARTWKQARCPSADEWIRKLWYIYTMEYSVQFSCSVVSDSLRPHGLQPTRLLSPCNSPGVDCPGNSPGVDCHFLFQGIFPTQGSNLGLPHCRQTLYRHHQGSQTSIYRLYKQPGPTVEHREL